MTYMANQVLAFFSVAASSLVGLRSRGRIAKRSAMPALPLSSTILTAPFRHRIYRPKNSDGAARRFSVQRRVERVTGDRVFVKTLTDSEEWSAKKFFRTHVRA